MRAKNILSILASSLTLTHLSVALGQTPGTAEHPRFFVWGRDGVPCGIKPEPGDFQTAVVKYLVGRPNPNLVPWVWETGTQAANRVFQYVEEHSQERTRWITTINNQDQISCHPEIAGQTYAPDLGTPEAICISIQGFGQKASNVDYRSTGGSDYRLAPFTFFREEDRRVARF